MAFKRTSFRVKIFVIIFIAILLPTISVSTIIYKKSEKAITDQTSKSIISSTSFAIENIDSSLNAIDGVSKSILVDKRLDYVAGLKYTLTGEEKVKLFSELRELLSFFSSRIKSTYMLTGIDSYYLYLKNQRAIINSKTTYYENVNEENIDFLQKFESNEYDGLWFVTTPVDYDTDGTNKYRLVGERLITYNKPITDEDGNMSALLAINVSENFISDYFRRIQIGTPGELVVIDKYESIVSHPDKSLIGRKLDKYSEVIKRINKLGSNSGSFFSKIDGEVQFVVYSISDYTKWKYMVIIPAVQVLGKVSEIQNFLVIVISITVFLVLGITLLLSYVFYKPLEKLVVAMQQVENRNLDVRIDDKRDDEYHKVYQGFNDMVTELKRLIKDLTNEKILKKEAEIKLLQAKLNPHFLYNTLESIHSIAKIKKVDEISSMVSAMSKFFRISLSGGKDIVTLKEAVDLVVSYLTVQNIRFKGKVAYNIDIPEELMGYKVPKLILQPIVENSIYHGIEKKKGKGQLTISALKDSGYLKLVVEDNGVGIKEEDLKELMGSINSENFEDSSNFALKNLNLQLKLKYGQESGISIESVYGEGTRVIIKLYKI